MADFDAGIGVILVLMSFVALMLFITKWKPEFSPYRPNADDVPEVPMVGIQLPFSLQITGANNVALRDGVKVQLKSDCDCTLQMYWGVECSHLQHSLLSNPLQLVQQANIVLEDNFVAQNDPKSFSEGSEEDILIEFPGDIKELNLGPPPRTKYPLCLIIRSREGLDSQDQLSIVGCIILIHLPDSTLEEKCHIISHLLVTNRGQAHDLQSLYMASDRESGTSSHPSQSSFTRTNSETAPQPRDSQTHNTADVARDCTVCQNAPISRVILPCRHACICDSCFGLVAKCPMCRGTIHSFFSMDTGSRYQSGLLGRNNEDRDWMDQIEDWCERFNQWIGFNQ